MKSILSAIKSTLQGSTYLDYVADAGIVIETDDNFLPAHPVLPMITIKDGGITRERDSNSSHFFTEYKVNINLWQTLYEDDKSIIGSGSTYGVLDLQEDVDTILHENTLAISGMLDVYCKEESPSEVVELSDLALVRKTMVYTYQRIEEK